MQSDLIKPLVGPSNVNALSESLSLPPGTMPVAHYSLDGSMWTDSAAAVIQKGFAVGGVTYAGLTVTDPWNGVKSVSVEAGSESLPSHLAYVGFVEAHLDFHAAPAAVNIFAMGEKRGAITTASGDDSVIWITHSNAPGPDTNSMSIDTGAGNDTVLAAADGRTDIDGNLGHGPMWNATYNGRYSVAVVSSGSGDDRISTLGKTQMVADGGAGNDTIRGGNGDDTLTGGTGDDLMWGRRGEDTFVFHGGDGHDRIEGFHSGEDHLRILGESPQSVHWTVETSGGTTGVMVTYGTEGDSIFLAGVATPNVADLLVF